MGSSEITSTQLVCHGTPGEPGTPGEDGTDGANALVNTTTVDVGAGGCENGGVRIDYGTDDNGNGVLDAAEIDDTETVCNGIDASTPTPPTGFTFQLLHFADIDGAGGVDDVRNFSALVNGFRAEYPNNTLVLSSGDNLIPGPEFYAAGDGDNAAIAAALAGGGNGRAHIAWLNAMGVQASALGNHDLDASPGDFAELIDVDGDWSGAQFPYLAANVDFSASALADLTTNDGQPVQPNRVAGSATVVVDGETIGLVGAATPILPSITNTSGLVITPQSFTADNAADLDALAAAIQPSVDALVAQGIDKIILLAHMQQIDVEKALATRLNDVDIIVAGGSNTLLADSNDRLRDGDTAADTYPLVFTSPSDEPVLVVNTEGDFEYLGRLLVTFDDAGVIDESSLDPAINGAYATDVISQPFTPIAAVDEIADAMEDVLVEKDGNVLGFTSVYLEGRRSAVRTEETNLGNLTADANLWLAKIADPSTLISIKNGGGIRDKIGQAVFPPGSNDEADLQLLPPAANETSGKPAGGISQLDIETSLRFNNSLTLLTVTGAELADIIEHAVSATREGATPGQFPQVAGLRFSFDPGRPARDADDINQADVNINGDRLRNLAVVDDSGAVITHVVEDGIVVAPTETFRLVILNFIAGCVEGGSNTDPSDSCGDSYPLKGLANPNRVDLPTLGFAAGNATFADPGTEQDALAEYLLRFHQAVPHDLPETATSDDLRIENLSARDDAVMTLPQGDISLSLIGRYTGSAPFDEGAAEIVAFDAGTQRVFVTNANAKTIDVLDLSDPTNPTLITSLDGSDWAASEQDFDLGGFNSVAVHDGIVAVAAEHDTKQENGRVVFYDANTFNVLAVAETGALPDMVTFTPDGSKVLVANEGEPSDDYSVDPEGSVTIVDISGGLANANASLVTFDGYDDQREDIIAAGIRIFGPDATVAQDLEPEYIAVSPDSSKAFVTLQENNALAIIDLNTNNVQLGALRYKDHRLADNGMDVAEDGEITIAPRPAFGLFMPDAIAAYGTTTTTFLVTANEGDTRDYDGYSEEADLGEVFPAIADLDPSIVDLLSTTAGVDFGGDGEDEPLAMGARSFSIWSSQASRLYDSGDDFERITAHLDRFGSPDHLVWFDNDTFVFNAGNDDNDRDSRSDSKGPEPEGVVTAHINDRYYAFIGLERVGGIMVYDVSNPVKARFMDYVNYRDFTVDIDAIASGNLPPDAAGDLGPEGLAFIPAEDSPNGLPLLIVGNEVTSA